MASEADEFQIIIIVTDHWTEAWFRQLLLPFSSYKELPEERLTFFDIAAGSFPDHFNGLLALLRKHGAKTRCFSCTDVAMELYSAVLEYLQQAKDPLADALTGGHFLSFQLATNKLATRRLVSGCDGLKAAAVMSDDIHLPDLGSANFFKPLAECGSKGVFRFEGGDVKNPLHGTNNPSQLLPEVKGMLDSYPELQPFNDEKLVGIVEQYVDPKGRRICSIDGFIHNGKIYHYTISENVYKQDKPEELDSLVTPAQDLPPATETKLWELYDVLAGDLVRRGINNQFLDYEGFVFPSGEVAVMEINCRTFSNQLPIFSLVFGEHDMLTAAIDLLGHRMPSFTKPIPKDVAGVCSYEPVIAGAPDIERKALRQGDDDVGTAFYYSAGLDRPYTAHIYVVLNNAAGGASRARQYCNEFYQELKQKYNPSDANSKKRKVDA